jgi:ABC-2 type transport system ATP-binding protein
VASIEILALSKTFRDFFGRRRVQALDGLSFSVKAGEVFGLLGPNGSGKSTAFKIAVGLLRPTSGRVTVNGAKPGTLAARRATGFLPEDSTLLPFLTAIETLKLHGALAGLGPREAADKSAELLERMDLTGAAKRKVKGFSKGMQRRLGIATVLIANPDVFILDEPTSGLDPLGAVQVKELIGELRAQGKAILISSHLLGELENVCDRVAFLNQGKLLREGTLDELLRETRIHELRLSPPNPEAIKALIELAKQKGLDVVSSRSPMRTLEAFYVSILGKDKQP